MERFNIFREKKTKEEVEQEIYNRHEGKLEMIGDYTDTVTKTLFHCNVCGNKWETSPHSILRGYGCPKCGIESIKNKQRKQNHEVKQEIANRYNGNIELVGDYVNGKTKTQFHCNICGNDWEAQPSNVIQGHGCPKCSKKLSSNFLKKPINQVTKELSEIHDGKIELVGDYINNKTKTLFHCNICGNEWETRPHEVLRGRGCPRCGINSRADIRRKTRDQVAQEVINIHKGKIELVGENYVNTSTKTLFHCNVCGNEWEAKPNSVLSGRGCPRCGKKSMADKGRLTSDQVAQKVSKAHNGNIEMVGDYVNTQTKTLFHCNKCGNEWEAKPNSILNGSGCPRCAYSHGEDYIASWLEKNWSKDDWVSQKKFKGLKGTGGGLLSYDFYIPSKNLCIEMQGMQHYTPITHFGGESQFLIRQEHDRRKKQYCQEHGMTLLEIRHDEMDMIDDILDKALKS